MTSSVEIARLASRVFWVGGEPRPILVQMGFVVLLHLASFSRLADAPWGATDPVAVALLLADGSLVVTFLVAPRIRRADVMIRVLANVDLAIIGVSALQTDVGTLPLVVLPAMWLARQLGWRSLWRVALSTAVLVTLPGALLHGNADDTAAQLVPLPFIAMMAAVAISVGLDTARQAQHEAERQRNEAQRALVELADQRRATDAIVETVDVGLVLLDAHGRTLIRNDRQRAIDALKHPEGRQAGRPQRVFGQDGRTSLSVSSLLSTLASRGEEFDDLRIWVGDNPSTRRALSVSARRVHDERGREAGAVLAYKDVTDLVRALHVKDEFIALVSHELRTPLTSIFGYVGILRESDDLPEQAVRQLEVIDRNAHRLKALVDQLLDASQLTRGALDLHLRGADLAEIVRSAASAAAPAAAAAGVDLRLQVGGPVRLDLDHGRMSQVVANLISNAVKYSEAGGRVDIALTAYADRIELAVADTGIGIAAEDLPELFAPFFRAQEAADRAIQGAGLGLAITRTIVEGHGGRIDVHSERGAGTVFTVVLPPAGHVAARAAS